MRVHPVILTEEAERDLVDSIDDPDVQDDLLDWIEDSLSQFPRAHTRKKKLGPDTRIMRDRGWTVVYDVSDDDPSDEEGAEVWVRHVWPSRGEELDDLARLLGGRRF